MSRTTYSYQEVEREVFLALPNLQADFTFKISTRKTLARKRLLQSANPENTKTIMLL
jgi:hypothetical protein